MAPQPAADAAPPKVPPPLPPSVEEAYRRKCVQLRNRTNEVEDTNDAARLRLARIKRQLDKLRIERAFLLEQLTKRTSTNVEDSDGSPSPPPTPDFASRVDVTVTKPQEKPSRSKKSARKTSVTGDAEGTQSNAGASFEAPASPSVNGSQRRKSVDGQPGDGAATPGGSSKPIGKAARRAFEIFSEEHRDSVKKDVEDKEGDATTTVEAELKKRWEELSEEDKKDYRKKADDKPRKSVEKAVKKEDEHKDTDAEKKDTKSQERTTTGPDEDVDMTDHEVEDQETKMDQDS